VIEANDVLLFDGVGGAGLNPIGHGSAPHSLTFARDGRARPTRSTPTMPLPDRSSAGGNDG
jgi:hypothetical protein